MSKTNPEIFKSAAGELVPAVETIGQFRENAILLGIASGSVESVYRTTSAGKYAEIVKKAQEEEKARREQMTWLDLLDQLNDQIDWLKEQAANKVREIEVKYGEDWREQAAHIVFDDPDDIPERADGESMAAYRERLERELIDELYDENGQLKDKFRDHPDPLIRELVELAGYHRELAAAELDRDYVNESGISQEERTKRAQDVTEKATYRQNYINARDEEATPELQTQAGSALDEKADEYLNSRNADADNAAFNNL